MSLQDMLATSLEHSHMCPTCNRALVYVCVCSDCLTDHRGGPVEMECTGCLAAKFLRSTANLLSR